jgi:hypothetical protein
MQVLDGLFANSAAMASDTTGQYYKEYDKLKKDLACRMQDWEDANMSMEELQKERASLLNADQ